MKHDEDLKRQKFPGTNRQMNSLRTTIDFLRSRKFPIYSFQALEQKYLLKLQDCAKYHNISVTAVSQPQYDAFSISATTLRRAKRAQKAKNARIAKRGGKVCFSKLKSYNGVVDDIENTIDEDEKLKKTAQLIQRMKQDFILLNQSYGSIFDVST